MIGLGEKLDAAGSREFAEEIEHFGRERLELLERGAADRVRDAELAVVSSDEIEDEAGGGQVALGRHLAADLGVLAVVEIERIGIEDAVAAQPEGLVELEVENNARHRRECTGETNQRAGFRCARC